MANPRLQERRPNARGFRASRPAARPPMRVANRDRLAASTTDHSPRRPLWQRVYLWSRRPVDASDRGRVQVPKDTIAGHGAISLTFVHLYNYKREQSAGRPFEVTSTPHLRDCGAAHPLARVLVDASDRGRVHWWEPPTNRRRDHRPQATRRHADTSTARHEDKPTVPRRRPTSDAPRRDGKYRTCLRVSLWTRRIVDLWDRGRVLRGTGSEGRTSIFPLAWSARRC